MAKSPDNAVQLEIMQRLQTKLLKQFEAKLDNGELSDTGMATLARMLSGMGWSIEDEIANGLKSKLTKDVDPNTFDEYEASIVGRIA